MEQFPNIELFPRLVKAGRFLCSLLHYLVYPIPDYQSNHYRPFESEPEPVTDWPDMSSRHAYEAWLMEHGDEP